MFVLPAFAHGKRGDLVPQDNDHASDDECANARRVFLAKCGRFAAVTGPAVALMLTFSSKTEAFEATSTAVVAQG
jgi:hypothetical protein